jgi:hypothetical protein
MKNLSLKSFKRLSLLASIPSQFISKSIPSGILTPLSVLYNPKIKKMENIENPKDVAHPGFFFSPLIPVYRVWELPKELQKRLEKRLEEIIG